MKKLLLVTVLLAASTNLYAVDGGAVLGGAVGGAAGAAIGHQIGGTNGSILGAAIGGATGAAVGSKDTPAAVLASPRQAASSANYTEERCGDHGKHKGDCKHESKHERRDEGERENRHEEGDD